MVLLLLLCSAIYKLPKFVMCAGPFKVPDIPSSKDGKNWPFKSWFKSKKLEKTKVNIKVKCLYSKSWNGLRLELEGPGLNLGP